MSLRIRLMRLSIMIILLFAMIIVVDTKPIAKKEIVIDGNQHEHYFLGNVFEN